MMKTVMMMMTMTSRGDLWVWGVARWSRTLGMPPSNLATAPVQGAQGEQWLLWASDRMSPPGGCEPARPKDTTGWLEAWGKGPFLGERAAPAPRDQVWHSPLHHLPRLAMISS